MIDLSPSRTLKALMCCALLAFGSISHAQQVFRITAIPDESPTELARKASPLVKYLESKHGMKVEFTPVSDYPAAVEVMVNKKVDLVWFGGFTYVQASLRSGGKVIPLATQREYAEAGYLTALNNRAKVIRDTINYFPVTPATVRFVNVTSSAVVSPSCTVVVRRLVCSATFVSGSSAGCSLW